ncbi:uncharacterized protein in vnfD 5'region-like [Planococcus citri]|uniref:uncharacterized protein in vnfD 5'region-like n=1 Tax=Planococcus citri TaxID=170843 RepID=UPI0031F967A3
MIDKKIMKIFTIFSLHLYLLPAVIWAEDFPPAQNLSSGTTLFAKIRSEGMVYVDKTAFIEKILQFSQPPFILLTRPRGFGKTTFVDTLYEFFSGNKALFDDTYIAKQIPGNWTKYPIIRLNFSFIRPINSDADIDRYREDLADRLRSIGKEHGLDPASRRYSYIDLLIEDLKRKYGQPVIVLIDEYDEIFKKVNPKDPKLFSQFMKVAIAFFHIVISQSDNLELVFITGISRLSMSDGIDGMRYGVPYMCIEDMTFNKKFSSAMGFTLDEIKSNYGPSLQRWATHDGVSTSTVIQNLTHWYDGYRFSLEDNETRVFNPISVINTFMNLKIDKYWAKSVKIDTEIERTMKMSEKKMDEFFHCKVKAKDLESLYDNEFSFEVPPAILLHNYGYLTIRKYNQSSGTVILSYPNEEIKSLMT